MLTHLRRQKQQHLKVTVTKDETTSIEGSTTTSKDVETIPAPPDNGPY